MFDEKISSIAPRRIWRKLPDDIRPTKYQLYQFFVGNKSAIPPKTRKKMAKLLEEDFNKMKNYLLHD